MELVGPDYIYKYSLHAETKIDHFFQWCMITTSCNITLNAYVGNKQNPSFNWKWYCETHAKKGIDIT